MATTTLRTATMAGIAVISLLGASACKSGGGTTPEQPGVNQPAPGAPGAVGGNGGAGGGGVGSGLGAPNGAVTIPQN